MENAEKRDVAIKACLAVFLEKGLYSTTSRDLSRAMKLQSGGLYYYFAAKDEAVLACAEEASFLLENGLILPALEDSDDPPELLDNLRARADSLAPTMKFLAQVCSENRYRKAMQPALERLERRNREYVRQFSAKYYCQTGQIEPYVYLCITAMVSYMLFGKTACIEPQLRLVECFLRSQTQTLSQLNRR